MSKSADRDESALRRRLIRDGILLGILIVLGAIAVPFADVASPTWAEGRSIADRLDDAYAAVWRDGSTPEEAASVAGLRLDAYATEGGTVWVMSVPEPSASAERCYGLRFGGGGPTDAVRFRVRDGCVPYGRAAFEATGTWSDVLGTERVTSIWFVPAMVVLVGGAVAVLTDAVIAVITT